MTVPSRCYILPLLALAAAFIAPGRAADAPAPVAPAADTTLSRFDRLAAAGVKLTRGPATAKLGDVAEIKVPAGFAFIGSDGLKRFYEITENSLNGQEVGVLVAPRDWMLFFSYDAVGYVKDDEKDKLDADKLFLGLTEHQDEANAARKQKGWTEIKTVGWATKPYYDGKTNNLKWALTLASSEDNFKEHFINQSIRLLGRAGLMNVTLVCGTESFKDSEVAADRLLGENFGYVSGQKYSEWKTGDKVAAYGLGALVLGGAGVLASKAGLLAKLGVFFAKFFKVILVAGAALGAVIVKLWKKITGRA